jgi:hypothetical protein
MVNLASPQQAGGSSIWVEETHHQLRGGLLQVFLHVERCESGEDFFNLFTLEGPDRSLNGLLLLLSQKAVAWRGRIF